MASTTHAAPAPARPRLTAPPHRYLDRERSWLEFNERVLALAEDSSTPLLERAKFLAIFATNLDEFHMVRVAGLLRQRAAGQTRGAAPGLRPSGSELALIRERLAALALRHARLFAGQVRPALAAAGLRIAPRDELSSEHRDWLATTFAERIYPVLTPLAAHAGEASHHVASLSLNLAVVVEHPATRRTRLARVGVPPALGRFLELDGGIWVPIEEVIAANAGRLFPGMRIVEVAAFRVTHDADLEIEDDGAAGLLGRLELQASADQPTRAVRLEVESSISSDLLGRLTHDLGLLEADVHVLPGPLDLGALWQLHAVERPDLKDPPFEPRLHPDLLSGGQPVPDLFAAIARQDVVLHHPYDAFDTSVQRFIEQAAADPRVLAIKQTLYRTSGDSPIVDALVRAAAAGKQVVVVVEIKARFDEQNNIGWARVLERAGCHVVHGVSGLKTHAKLCLVVRDEGSRLRRYVHVGTGNYNPVTARVYEDVGLLTASPRLGADVSRLFNFLTGYATDPGCHSLIVAPRRMRQRIIELIEREARLSTARRPGRIVMKVNNLADEAVIEALYVAAGQGVEIDLIVRAICTLRPGVPGLSERIRVRSILGRFLEHSRILLFGNGGDAELYVGSADLMHRNLDRRVEAMVRVESAAARDRLAQELALGLADNVGSWRLDGDGAWSRLHPGPDGAAHSLQLALMERVGPGLGPYPRIGFRSR